MSKYSLILSTHIQNVSRIAIWELCKNDKSIFESFVSFIEEDANLFGALASAIRIVEDTADLIRKPKTKFREIKGHRLPCKLYEAKSGIIRICLFHQEKTGRVVVTGGLKDRQVKDIKAVIRIIKEYYNESQ